MNLQLHNKTALVTASTAGIGFAIAQTLAHEGVRVIVNGRSQERVDHAIATIASNVPTATLEPLAADLATPQGVAQTLERFPSVDILVNNLGVYGPKPFEDISDQDWSDIIETNFMSGVRLSRQYLAKMKASTWGRILFISNRVLPSLPK